MTRARISLILCFILIVGQVSKMIVHFVRKEPNLAL